MPTTLDPGDHPSPTDGPSEPRVTLGVVMLATVLLPALVARYFGPEAAGRLVVAMIPFLFVAASRTSITTYSVFER